ncbi:MAG: ATP-dependent Clp protease ATP-binding subunit, partial [Clostridia bacterium]|nr:ATP-dependent Clp protease ATP-binding subunit [Clostridia bacterium]
MYTERLQQVFDYADSYERAKRFGEINSRHLLMGLLNVESTAQQCLRQVGITKDNTNFQSDRFGFSTIYEGEEIRRLRMLMANVCNLLGDNAVDCMHLLLAILFDKTCYAYTSLNNRLGQVKLNQLASAILSAHPNKDAFFKALSGSGLEASQAVAAPTKATTSTHQQHAACQEATPAIPYGTDITQKAREGKFDPVIGRDDEIARIVQILSRRNKNNPVLVGEPGVGKSAVVEGLAQAIVNGKVPTSLQGKKLVELDIAGMVAGTRYRGDFEERLKTTLEKVAQDGDVILFIDEIHNLVGAGGNAESSMDAAEIMKPVLARGGLQTIGATTLDEYRRYIEKDPALERRFQQVLIAEPSQDDAIAILRGVKAKYEEHHGVQIADDAITSAVKLSVRYVNDRFLPDKAFDLIDEACSKVKISALARPESLTTLIGKLNQLKAQKQALLAGNPTQAQIDQIDQAYTDLYNQYQQQNDAYNLSKLNGKTVVTAEDVASVVAQWTGVPVSQISQSEKDKLLNLEAQLAQRVIGQSK